MAFLNTLDNGQYSPTLCIHTGVNFSVETLPFNSGKADTNPLVNERVRGNYDYISRFPGGFFNFENYYPTINTPSVSPTELRVYSIDGQFSGIQKQYTDKLTGIYQHNSPSIINYWNSSTNLNVIAQSGIKNFKDIDNFGTVLSLCDTGIGGYIDAEGNTYLNVLGSAIIASGPGYVPPTPLAFYAGPKAEITVYGRFKINTPDSLLVAFGTNYNLFPANGSGQSSNIATRNNIEISNDKLNIWNNSYSYGNSGRTLGTKDVSKASGFYQFVYSFLQNGLPGRNTYTLLYEGDDVNPLRLTFSGQVVNYYNGGLDGFHSGITLLTNKSGVLWSEIGIDNRAWQVNDINEFSRSRLYPSSFVDDSPTLLPVDNDYLNFHFPVNSVGSLGATNSGDYTDIGYTVTLQPSGLSPYIYEFDRSEFNPTALRIRTVMQSISNNPSGYLKAKVELDGQDKYWESYPVNVPSIKSEVLMSGQIYDMSGNSLDLTEVVASGISGSRLKLGAWYNDNGSSWGGNINIYSAKVELDSWLIPQPSATENAISLNMKAGVVFCQQSLYPNPNIVNPLAYIYNSKVCGNFDYAKFECGYYNFENTPLETIPATITDFPLYSYDYRFGGTQYLPPNNNHTYNKPLITDSNLQRGHQVAKDAMNGVQNFSTAIIASGNSYFNLLMPNSGDIVGGPVFGSMTLYGRLRVPQPSVNPYNIVQFGNNNNNLIVLNRDKLRFYFKRDNNLPKSFLDAQYPAYGDFYNFMLIQQRDGLNQCKLYESYNSQPLQLTNIITNESVSGWFSDAEGTNFTCGTNESPIAWTDFGISNRAWSDSDILEFQKSKFYTGFYISENPSVSLPVPNGADSTYLNFHYPLNSSGDINITNGNSFGGALNTISYYLPLSSGLSQSLYEFDRSQFNQTALKVDMWVKNVGSNPSGNINTRIAFTDGSYWQSVDVPINNIDVPMLVSFSGQFYNYAGNPSDMSKLTKNDFLIDNGIFNPSYTASLGIGTWYNDIHMPYSGDINVYSARVYMDAYCVPPMTGNVLTLYTSGQQVSRDGIDLFIQNSFSSESVDLYINGYSSQDSSCDLYIAGGFSFKDTTLYIGGKDYLNDNTTLFIEGSTVKGSMPMYIYSQSPSEMSGNLPLSIWATANPANANQMSLFIGENAPSGIKTNGMNLYAIGPQSERITASMNLFLKRDSYDDKSSVTLFCRNELTALDGQITLFMSAPSGTLGAVPVSGQMNLFIERAEGIQDGIDMVIKGPEGNDGCIPMSIEGGPPTYNSISLITDGIGVDYNTLKVYINGF